MKKIFLLAVVVTCSQIVFAQMDLPPSGNNPRAKITEEVGITDITISYSRPDVNKREGKIWGNLVTYGFSTQSLVTNKNTNPWRAGANENTTIAFEHDVKVEGKNIKAGTYGLSMAVWPDSVMLIFSNQSNAWGSFFYDEKYDALRVTVKPVALNKSVEWLKYEFIEHNPKGCTIAMMWENLMVPFKIDVDVNNIVVNRLREQVTSQKGFNNLMLVQAAQFCLNNDVNLEEALNWSQRAAGFKSYATLRNLAFAYEKLNRLPQADSVMTEALTMANVNQYAGYCRQICQKRPDRAIEVMTAAKTKFGDVFIVNNTLMFAYSAKGDFKKATEAANKASTQAPNDAAKATLDGQIAKLKEGKDIN